jgi:hypothetical protein
MKKVLIVHSEQSRVIGLAIRQVVGLVEFEAELCLHSDALATLLSGEYSHIIVLDYSEGRDKGTGGFASYRDLSASATGQKILRCGMEKFSYPDYWGFPGEISVLFNFLLGKKEDGQ